VRFQRGATTDVEVLMQNTNVPGEKQPGEWPEAGKQGGQGDIGTKGGKMPGDYGEDSPAPGDQGKQGRE
jgi:hypothetical protein